LRQRLDQHLVNHVVGQILVEVGETVGVLAESLVLTSQSIASSDPPEFAQVHNVESADVISSALEVIPPVSRLPKSLSIQTK